MHAEVVTMLHRRMIIFVIASLGWLLIAQHTFAVEYPTKLIKIVVPFPPGGSNDVQARLIAKGLSERLGKPVVVDNRPGAGGRIGAGIAAGAAPDGHTLFFASTATLVIEPALHAGGGFDPQRDFSPITIITEMPMVLVASPSLPVKSVAALIALARQRPGELTYASAGPGTTLHLAGETFKASNKLDMVHVPYKGEAMASMDVIGGQVSMMFITPVAALSNIRAGKLHALAVTGQRRIPALPDLQTLSEIGQNGPDQQLWFALLAPAKTPADVIAILHKETVAVLKSAQFTKAVEDLGAFVVASSPRQLTERMQSESISIAKTIKSIDLKVDD
jgi:tripartite-type tricarboxylate transporter receptor subunit TctC